MKTFKYIILIYICSIFSILQVFTQDTMLQPLELGAKSQSFSYSDTKNTNDFSDSYSTRTQKTKDVFYKFAINTPMDIVVYHCGSVLGDTYLYVLNSSGIVVASNDDYSGVGKCSNSMQSYIKLNNLQSGVYFVVSEGYSQNGIITTTIEGIKPLPASGLYDGNAATHPANAGYNYILTITPTVPTSDVRGLGVNESLQSVQYFDGLGRPIQTVQRGITPDKKDLATYIDFDGVGRESVQWLPIPTDENGAFTPKSLFTSGSEIYTGDNRPFIETIYEPSPLNRIKEQFGAGQNWETNNKRIETDYQTNANEVAYYFVNSSGVLEKGANYLPNSLYKTLTTDEDGNKVIEYKDKLGQTILKQNFDGTAEVNTYYVYNDLGQLSYVLPPIASDNYKTNASGTQISDNDDFMGKYAYLYKYDERGNCIEKRLPGCAPIYMIYDKTGRMVLSQDGNQRSKLQWTVTKYDQLGRVAYTGLMITANTTTRNTLTQTLKDIVVTESFNESSTYFNSGYSNTAIAGFTTIRPLIVNYYDSYKFRRFQTSLSDTTKLRFTKLSEFDDQFDERKVKGLLTGTRTYLLDNSGSYLVDAFYYDYRGQIVQQCGNNHLGGYVFVYNSYNFRGAVKKNFKKMTDSAGSLTLEERYDFEFDHAGRTKTILYQIGNKPQIVLVSYTYDDLGRIIGKLRHNGLDAESYTYNIRNWIKKITSSGFEQNLYYNENLPVGINPCFNGNVAYNTWTYNNKTKGYAYKYDNLNRLKEANFKQLTSTQVNGSFDENFTYDKHGNILTLKRIKENSYIDILNYDYSGSGNQIRAITDVAGSQNLYNTKEYQDKNGCIGSYYDDSGTMVYYDANGNMIKDYDRNILLIKYNVLNLPDVIWFSDGSQIINKYDAGGRKLYTKDYTLINALASPLTDGDPYTAYYFENYYPTTSDYVYEYKTDYVDNVEFKTTAGQAVNLSKISRISNPEGYTTNCFDFEPRYSYNRLDHLGNVREVWRASYKYGTNGTSVAAASTTQRTQYYPSGLPWYEGTGASTQNRKYNGKEFVEMHGLDEYDSEARWMYPAIMRTTTIDPLAEMYYSTSPYAWCGNNPVNSIDPTGMATMGTQTLNSTVVDENGEVIYHKDDPSDKNIYFSPDGKKGSDGDFTGLDVVGTEQAGYSYKLGSEIPVGHLSNDGIRIITGWDIKNLEDDDDAYMLIWIFESVFGNLTLNPSQGLTNSRNIRGFRAPMKYLKSGKVAAKTSTTTVGRWMSQAEYAAMKNGSPAAVGAGGKTSVTVGGPTVWSSAKSGSVYVEFQVPTNSLVPGGGQGIYSILGPNAGKSQLFQLQKLGGQVSPPVKNISPILKVK